MPERTRLRDPRTWTLLPAVVAVSCFAVGYLVWLLVGLDSGLECRDTALSCGSAGWSTLIRVLWTAAAVLGAVAAAGLLVMVARSLWAAFAHLR